MGKYAQIRVIIEELFADNRRHEIGEIRKKGVERGVDIASDSNAISNILFQMKSKGFLRSTGNIGEYERTVSTQEIAVTARKASCAAHDQVDWNEFFVLNPPVGPYSDMRVTCTEKGEIRLNSKLYKAIGTNEIELIFSKNYKTMLLNPARGNCHRFTKAGTAKNREMTGLLKKQKLVFPVTYVVEWDENYQMWRGNLKIENKK